MNDFSIVLDMDGTLIGRDGDPRPYLKHFLKFCFRHCRHIAIWTAASLDWYETVYFETFLPILTSIGKSLGKHCFFTFVYTRNRCILRNNYDYEGCRNVLKPLFKVWRKNSGHFKDIRRENTIFIDDTYSTYQRNYGNAILVPQFVDNADDDVLFYLCLFLKYLGRVYERLKTIRTTEKREWYAKSRALEFQPELFNRPNSLVNDSDVYC